MTPEEFIKWVDAEINKCQNFIQYKALDDNQKSWQYGRLNGLYDARNTFAIFVATSQINKTIDK